MVDIAFRSAKLRDLCSKEKEMTRRLGTETAARLKRRLAELQAADALEDLRSVPSARCHELAGGRKGQLALDLGLGRRLVVESEENPPPRKPNGGLDWEAVTSIVVVEVVDYH